MEQNAPEVSKNIKIAILRSSKLTFWKNQCLIQAFVARRMLNRRNTSSKAYLGLIQVEKSRYIAHAWIEASGIEVVKGTPGCIKVHEF